MNIRQIGKLYRTMAARHPSPISITASNDRFVRMQAAEHHSASILARLFNNELCDVTLYGKPPSGAGNAGSLLPIKAHKNILAVVSPFLYEHMTVHGTKSTSLTCQLDQVDHNSLRSIVTFIYKNFLQFPRADAAGNIQNILLGAKHLAINDLASSCETYLANTEYNLCSQTCISTWLFAVQNELNVLLHACVSMFAANVKTIRSFSEFLQLDGDNLVLLLKSVTTGPFKYVCDAEDLRQAANAWLEQDGAERKRYAVSIEKLMPVETVLHADANIGQSRGTETTVVPISSNAAKRNVDETGVNNKGSSGKRETALNEIQQKTKFCKTTTRPAGATSKSQKTNGTKLIAIPTNALSTGADLICYTDGACSGNGQTGAVAGIGVFFGPESPFNVSEPLLITADGKQTNNRAEIMAVVRACEQLKSMGKDRMIVRTDSKFVIDSMTSWVKNWQKNGWRNSAGKAVENRQQFELLLKASEGLHIRYEYVPGHKGDFGNEQADKSAREGCNKKPSSKVNGSRVNETVDLSMYEDVF